MPNYEKMYYTLFQAITTVTEALQAAQQQGEDIYVDTVGDAPEQEA